MVAASLASGALMWVLWDHLRETRLSLFSRSMLLLGLGIVPSGAFLMTQSFNESASLLLFLLSWRSFVQFTRDSKTEQGFFAGLILGLAFYFSVYALLYAVMYALLAPFFYEWVDDLPKEKRLPAAVTGMLVISFPTMIEESNGTYRATADLKLDRVKWDITYNSGSLFDIKKLGDKMIYDEIEIALDLRTLPKKSM